MTNRWMVKELILNWIFMVPKVSHSNVCWCTNNVHPSSRGQNILKKYIVAFFYSASSLAMQKSSYFLQSWEWGEHSIQYIFLLPAIFIFINLILCKWSMEDRSAVCNDQIPVYNLTSLFPKTPSHFSPTPPVKNTYLNYALSCQRGFGPNILIGFNFPSINQ